MSYSRRPVLFDFDCCLVDYMDAFIRYINENVEAARQQPLTLEDCTDYDTPQRRYGTDIEIFFKDPDLYLKDLKPYEDSDYLIRKLESDGREVTIVTKTHPAVQKRKEEFIKDTYGDIKLIQVPFEEPKSKFVPEGCLMIDDWWVNIVDYLNTSSNNIGILFNYKRQHNWARLNRVVHLMTNRPAKEQIERMWANKKLRNCAEGYEGLYYDLNLFDPL